MTGSAEPEGSPAPDSGKSRIR